VEFAPDFVTIYDIHDNSMIVVGNVNHQSHLYTFGKLIAKSYSALLLTHVDDTSRLWHERFIHLSFKYMQQLCEQDMVISLINIHFSKGVCQACVLGKHPQKKFEKGKAWRASSASKLIHNDLIGPFPYPSINKARYMLTFIDDFSRYTWVYFLGRSLSFFSISKISKHIQRLNPGERSKSSTQTMGGNM
jgi:hypothetical protein